MSMSHVTKNPGRWTYWNKSTDHRSVMSSCSNRSVCGMDGLHHLSALHRLELYDDAHANREIAAVFEPYDGLEHVPVGLFRWISGLYVLTAHSSGNTFHHAGVAVVLIAVGRYQYVLTDPDLHNIALIHFCADPAYRKIRHGEKRLRGHRAVSFTLFDHGAQDGAIQGRRN